VDCLLPAGLSFVSAAGPGSYDPVSGRWTVGPVTVGVPAKPVFAFGEDEQGGVYRLTSSPNGKRVYRFGRWSRGGRVAPGHPAGPVRNAGGSAGR
jgi:hypothetical protein